MRDDAVLGHALPLDRGLGPFFIYSRAYNKYLSPMVNLIAVTTLLLTTGLHPCQQRIFKKTNFFMLLVPAFH